MRISTIISTYDRPDYLERVLAGFAVQSRPSDEIVIADDGSPESTRAIVDNYRRETGGTVQHIWHEDAGFRKCRILNRAIDAATGEYLIFTDGDCIPRRDFVHVHATTARVGRYLSGGKLRLPLTAKELTLAAIESEQIFQTTWLARQLTLGREMLRLRFAMLPLSLGVVWDALTPTPATFNGHNASLWKRDLLKVNGFDERMKYGGLDCELGERLERAGIRGVQIRHRACCLHLDHGRPYVDPQEIVENAKLRRKNHRSRVTWTNFGLQQLDRAVMANPKR